MYEIEDLAAIFKERGIPMKDGVMMSAMVDKQEHRTQLIKWLNENPQAKGSKIFQQIKKILKVDK